MLPVAAPLPPCPTQAKTGLEWATGLDRMPGCVSERVCGAKCARCPLCAFGCEGQGWISHRSGFWVWKTSCLTIVRENVSSVCIFRAGFLRGVPQPPGPEGTRDLGDGGSVAVVFQPGKFVTLSVVVGVAGDRTQVGPNSRELVVCHVSVQRPGHDLQPSAVNGREITVVGHIPATIQMQFVEVMTGPHDLHEGA